MIPLDIAALAHYLETKGYQVRLNPIAHIIIRTNKGVRYGGESLTYNIWITSTAHGPHKGHWYFKPRWHPTGIHIDPALPDAIERVEQLLHEWVQP